MTRLNIGERILAALLAALAGFVDAVGFLALGGFFVSFMSGNTTRMAVGLAEQTSDAAEAAVLISAFVIGVVAGSLTGHAAKQRRKMAVLALVAAALAAATILDIVRPGVIALTAAAFAMGALNAAFEANGEVRFGLTYMTGALVKIGQRIAIALRGGEPFGWAPWLLQWAALAAGAVLGAISHAALGLAALWVASGTAAILALSASFMRPDDA